jgi:hypothetical protein
MRLSTLKLLVQSVEETERATQEWRARPEMPAPFAIVRYKEALFVPTVYTFRCYEGNWSLGIPTNAGAGGAVNLTGSDMGSLVYRTRDGKALIAGQTVGMVGIVELIAPDNGDKWYVEVRHMSAVMPDLEWRFEALFPTQGSMVSARGRGR